MAITSFRTKDKKGEDAPTISNWASGSKATPKKAAPKKAKTQAEMTYPELVSRGPGYGSQAARVANQSTEDLARYIQNRVGGGQQNALQRTPPGYTQDMQRGAATGGGGGAITGGGYQSVGTGGGQGVIGRTPTGQASGGGVVTSPGTGSGSGSIGSYGYTPMQQGQLYDPQYHSILTEDLLAKAGITNPALADSLATYFNPAFGANFLLNGNDPNAVTDEATLSSIVDYLTQVITPNGQLPDFQDLLGTLFNSTDPNAGAVGNYLQYDQYGNPRTVDDQIDTALQLAIGSLSGINPYAQESYRGALMRTGNEYREDQFRTSTESTPSAGSYAEYLKNSMVGDWINR